MSLDDRELAARLNTVDALLAVRTLYGWLQTPVPDHVHFALRFQPTELATGLSTLALGLMGAADEPERVADMLTRMADQLQARLVAEYEMDRATEDYRSQIEAAERQAAHDAWLAGLTEAERAEQVQYVNEELDR